MLNASLEALCVRVCVCACACVLGVCQIMTVARFFGMLHTPVCVCVWVPPGLPLPSCYGFHACVCECVCASVCECVSKILLYLCEIGAPGTHNFEGTRTPAPASLSAYEYRFCSQRFDAF